MSFDNFSDIIIADLSIHYFSEKLTFNILKEIKRVLTPNGFLLFRVNSINDINYGSKSGIEIEPHLYKINDTYKRFFDKQDINRFFYDWELIYLQEKTMNRYPYSKEKVLWVGAAKKI